MKENKCLQFLKGVACLSVVLLHIPLPGIVGEAIVYGLRFPVPIFFMISGYFCYFKDLKWIKAQQWKLLRLLLCSEVACAIVNFIAFDEGIFEQMKAMRFWSHPVQTIMFGTLFNGTLWYLYAMLWTYLFVYFLKKKRILEKCYLFIPVVLSIHIIGRLLIQKYSDIDHWIIFIRSWFLYGAPFFLLGHLIAEKELLIKKHITNRECVFLLIAGGAVMVAEYMIWHCFMDIWLSTVLIASAMFLFAIVNPEKEIVPALAKIGKRYSKVIYVSHIPVSRILNACVKPFLTESVYSWAKPLLVMIGSLLIAMMIQEIPKRYRRHL